MLHIESRSCPAVNTDSCIHMHHLHAGRFLFGLQRWLFTVAHKQYNWRGGESWIYMGVCVHLVSPASFWIQIDLPLISWILFCKHSHTQSTIIIKDAVRSHLLSLSFTASAFLSPFSLCLLGALTKASILKKKKTVIKEHCVPQSSVDSISQRYWTRT